MSKSIQPVNVSPFIRGSRYTFLIVGWFYGVNKKAVLTAYERQERVKRKAKMEEEYKQKKLKSNKKDAEDLGEAFKDFGIEMEPGWEAFL